MMTDQDHHTILETRVADLTLAVGQLIRRLTSACGRELVRSIADEEGTARVLSFGMRPANSHRPVEMISNGGPWPSALRTAVSSSSSLRSPRGSIAA